MAKIYESGREIIFEGVELLFGSFRNFSGEKTKFNEAGKRNFNIQIDPEYIPFLIERGINVKYFKADLEDEDQDEKPGFVKVNVNYGGLRAPEVFVRYGSNGRFVELNEDSIGKLDHSVFDTVDLILNPSRWEARGESGTSLYLNKGYFTIHVDPLAAKYEQAMQDPAAADEEELPF